ncbi:MAG: rhomboid family intramembrane serine protease, partial [Oscillospiraceae bacterium]
MKWLDKLERKYGRFGIPDLMMVVSTVMVLVYLFDMVQNRIYLQGMLSLSRAAILDGQVWRLVSFIFAPPPSSPLFVLLAIYFYLFLGRTLENQWGSFRFTLYYLFGMLGCIAAAMLTGYGTNSYLNLSLFLAFAFLYPDLEVLLFFFLPIKVKYLAYLDWAFFALT